MNGCSLKTEENLAAARSIRPEKIMFETGNPASSFPPSKCSLRVDAPWCSMSSTQASKKHLDTLPASLRALYFPPSTKPESFVYGKPVKGRNEASTIGGVAWVIHRLNEGVPFDKVVEKAWKNTVDVFELRELA